MLQDESTEPLVVVEDEAPSATDAPPVVVEESPVVEEQSGEQQQQTEEEEEVPPQIVFPDEGEIGGVASIESVPSSSSDNITTLAAIDDLKSVQSQNGGGGGGGGRSSPAVITELADNDCYHLSDGATLSILFCPQASVGKADKEIVDIEGKKNRRKERWQESLHDTSPLPRCHTYRSLLHLV